MKPVITLFFLILSLSTLSSQEVIYNVKHYGLEDGLSHNRIQWTYKDNNGMMWIGAANGIMKFDGQVPFLS